MSNSATLGPWRIVTDDLGLPKHIVTSNYVTICSFLTSVKNSCEPESIEHNAKLIAAAPELLEFAIRVCFGESDDIRSLSKQGKAAIAKATGSEL